MKNDKGISDFDVRDIDDAPLLEALREEYVFNMGQLEYIIDGWKTAIDEIDFQLKTLSDKEMSKRPLCAYSCHPRRECLNKGNIPVLMEPTNEEPPRTVMLCSSCAEWTYGLRAIEGES